MARVRLAWLFLSCLGLVSVWLGFWLAALFFAVLFCFSPYFAFSSLDFFWLSFAPISLPFCHMVAFIVAVGALRRRRLSVGPTPLFLFFPGKVALFFLGWYEGKFEGEKAGTD